MTTEFVEVEFFLVSHKFAPVSRTEYLFFFYFSRGAEAGCRVGDGSFGRPSSLFKPLLWSVCESDLFGRFPFAPRSFFAVFPTALPPVPLGL